MLSDVEYRCDTSSKGPFNSIALLDLTSPMKPMSLAELREYPLDDGPSPEAIRAMQERNQAAVDLKNGAWDKCIRIGAEDTLPKDRTIVDGTVFGRQFPTTKGWVRTSLPVMLGDGRFAYVGVTFKWCWMHGASANFYLERVNGVWRVRSRKYSYYV